MCTGHREKRGALWSGDLISGQADSKVRTKPHKEKKTLPEAPASVSQVICVAALAAEATIVSEAPCRNINRLPFCGRAGSQKPATSEKTSPSA